MDSCREVIAEAFEECGGGLAVAARVDLQIDIAGRPVDGDKSIAFASLQRRQVLQIDVNEADRRLLEAAGLGLFGLGSLADAMALQAAMDGASGELGVEAAAHHLDDVVERQIEGGAQLADQLLFHGGQRDAHPLRPVRAVLGGGAASPAADGLLVHAELDGQFRHRGGAGLDVGPDFGRGGGVGVQVQTHARRSVIYATPRHTLIPSRQSRGTKPRGGLFGRPPLDAGKYHHSPGCIGAGQ